MNMETFAAANDVRTRQFEEAVVLGFNMGNPSEEMLDRMTAANQAAEAMLTEVTGSTSPAPEFRELPVGTFSRFKGTVNLGNGPYQAALITSVTVRATSKRQGILRKMMVANLNGAARAGESLALLTASSAAIYGRFGFRDVVDWGNAEIAPAPRFALAVRPTGTVEMVEMEWLYQRVPELFSRFHAQTRGSVSRFDGYYGLELELVGKDGKLDSKYLGAVHLDNDGNIDGYVIYWIENETHLLIRDLIYLNTNAELGLWEFLAAIEPLEKISWEHSAVNWALPRALVDRRAITKNETSDGLWARVLDPRVLAERPYRTDGTFSFTVEDRLEIASGAFTLKVKNGKATVVPATKASASVTVPALGALLFGSESVSELQQLDLIAGVPEDSLDELDVLFSAPGSARFATMF